MLCFYHGLLLPQSGTGQQPLIIDSQHLQQSPGVLQEITSDPITVSIQRPLVNLCKSHNCSVLYFMNKHVHCWQSTSVLLLLHVEAGAGLTLWPRFVASITASGCKAAQKQRLHFGYVFGGMNILGDTTSGAGAEIDGKMSEGFSPGPLHHSGSND